MLDEQGPGFGMSDARDAIAQQGKDADKDAVVSMPDGMDMAAAQQFNLEPGDVDVDKHGALQLHFDDSEDLLVTMARGVQELQQAAGPGAAKGGGSNDGGNVRVLLFTPHGSSGQVATGGGGGGKGSASMQRKVERFHRRLEEGLALLGRSGVAPDTLRIFIGSEWFRDEQGRPWSAQECSLATQLLVSGTASFMNILVVPGTLKWAASAMLGSDVLDDDQP